MKLNYLFVFLGLISVSIVVTTANAADASLVSSIATNLRASPTTGSGSRIEFATPIYDFGKVQSGQIIKYSFTFTNHGDQTLIITNVATSCNCTTAGNWDRRVEPGKMGILPIQFNTASLKGPFLRTITVMCNDPMHPATKLLLKGIVWHPVEFSPSYVLFNSVAGVQTNLTRSVRITNNLDAPLTVSAPVCTNKAFRVDIKTVHVGKVFELVVALDPPSEPGRIQAPIILKTSSTNLPVINLNAIAYIQKPVTISPTEITLPSGPLAAAKMVTVYLRNLGSAPLAVTEYGVNVPGATVNLQEAQSGRLLNLLVTFPAGMQIQPDQKIEVTAKTNHPQFPLIKVPVMQNPMPAPISVAGPAVTVGSSPPSNISAIAVQPGLLPMPQSVSPDIPIPMFEADTNLPPLPFAK